MSFPHSLQTRFWLSHAGISMFLSIMILFLPHATLAFGASPTKTIFEDVLPNTTLEGEVTFLRGDAEKKDYVEVSVSGDLAQYITLTDGQLIEFAEGERQKVYHFSIQTNNLAAGEYQGTILGISGATPPGTSQTDATSNTKTLSVGMTVRVGGQANVRVTIKNEEKEDYNIQQILFYDIEEQSPLNFTYLMNNTGNVDTRPGRITLIVTDSQDASVKFSTEVLATKFPFIPAFQGSIVDLTTDLVLPVGNYFVTATFFDKAGKQIFTDDSRFNVYPLGTLEMEGELISFGVDKTTYKLGEVIVFRANFKNTGNSTLQPVLITEIFQKGERIDLVKKDPVVLPVRRSADLELSFGAKEGGDFTAQAYVQYGPFRTDTKETSFIISEGSTLVIVGVLIGISCVIGLVVWLLHRRRNALVLSQNKKGNKKSHKS